MAHHPSLRAKALELRSTENLTIDQIAARLALSRTTVYHWVKDVPIVRVSRSTPGRRKGNHKMQLAFERKRDAAYAEGVAEFPALVAEATFRDFVCMYIGEGYKRSRNTVSIANSDPDVVVLGARWIRRFARNPVWYAVQYHADQDLGQLRAFWSAKLDVGADEIRLQRKSNSNGLKGRKWRSVHGVLTVGTHDTLLRARLQAWIDLVHESWAIDSAVAIGA